MTEQELSKYFWLKKEVQDLEERIATFGVGISSVKIKELNVEGSSQYESIQEKIIQLKDLWMNKRVEALEEYIKIESFINNIPDDEIRTIARYRFLDLKKWDEIGSIMNYDRTAVSKKLRGYLNENN